MRLSFGLPLVWMACGGENVIESKQNTAPVVVIASHSPDAEILEGYTETFRATVSDDDNEFEELSVAWYVGETIVCDWETVNPAGESYCDIVFNEEDSNVIAEVRDPQGAGGRAEIDVVIVPTQAPEVEILTPTQNGNQYSNELILFSAQISDNEDFPADLTAVWTSSVDGDLPVDATPDSDGIVSDYGYLTEGQHVIELSVTDTSGKMTKEQIILQVGSENSSPTCDLVAPESGTSAVVGESIIFEGLGSDANISASELTVSFESDKDGVLGNGTINSNGEILFTYDGFSNNDHIISMIVTDEVGSICQDTMLLQVGTPPTVNIDQPFNGDVITLGDSLIFQATVQDNEDQPNDLTAVWTSSLDGELYSGPVTSQNNSQFFTDSLSAGTHSISLQVTDTTGLISDSNIILTVNTPPDAPTISISPDPAYSNTDLSVAISSGLTDADGDAVTHYYQWYENGNLYTSTTNTVSAADLDVGDIWTVRVTPNDGYVDGAFTEMAITISNSLPAVSSPIISSNGGVYNDSVLTCSATASDADETVTPTYSWNVNGSVYNGATIDLSSYTLSVGDSVTCSATVTDSNGGMASAQTSDVIENRSPSVTSVSISPTSPSSIQMLTCASSASDPDGESLMTGYEWFLSGSSVGISNTLDLSTLSASPFDVVECVVTVSDSAGATDAASNNVTVANTIPTVDVLTLTPAEPTLNDTLSCYAEASDIDGDIPTLTFNFTNQTTGVSYTPTTTSTNLATLDVASTGSNYDDVLTCTVSAEDAQGAVSSSSTSVTIVNTSPVFDQGAVIDPTTVEIGTTATCSAIASDPDDGVASLSYIWQVNGSQVATGVSWLVNSTDASVGDSLTCTAVAIDFEGNTTTSTSVPSVISNTAPVVTGVLLNDLSPYTNDIITVASNASDFNGDSVTLSYEWHVLDASNGGQDTIIQLGAGSAFSSLDGSQMMGFDRDDEVYVLVTPNDGTDDGVTVESDHAMVQNSLPTSPSVEVLGATGATEVGAGEEDLVCSITGLSTDADGDSVDYTYDWSVDGGASQQTYANTTDMSDTYLASGVSLGTWTCSVTPNDGTDDGIPGEASMNAIARETCLNYYESGFVTDGIYTLESSSGTTYDAYCDMSNGGWTLVVAAQGNNSSYASTASFWWTAGSTTNLTSPTTTGKSPAYDLAPFTELKLAVNLTSSYVIANLSNDPESAVSLMSVVRNTSYSNGDPGCNDGSSKWNSGFKTFTATTRVGSFFSQDYIKVWHGDGQSDCDDRVVFSTSSGAYDWSGSVDNLGAIGAEFRMSSNNSDWYTVWIR